MTLFAAPWILAAAWAVEPGDAVAKTVLPHIELAPVEATWAPAPKLSNGWRAPLRLSRAQQSLEGPPVREVGDRHRSRNLLLGALAAEAAAGGLLGAAIALKGNYETTDEPTRGLYRANRVAGHAGYASAIAGGAMFLGALRMWEW